MTLGELCSLGVAAESERPVGKHGQSVNAQFNDAADQSRHALMWFEHIHLSMCGHSLYTHVLYI